VSRLEFSIVRTLRMLESGEDVEDALSFRSFSAKEPLVVGLFCGKLLIQIEILNSQSRKHVTGWQRCIGGLKF